MTFDEWFENVTLLEDTDGAPLSDAIQMMYKEVARLAWEAAWNEISDSGWNRIERKRKYRSKKFRGPCGMCDNLNCTSSHK